LANEDLSIYMCAHCRIAASDRILDLVGEEAKETCGEKTITTQSSYSLN